MALALATLLACGDDVDKGGTDTRDTKVEPEVSVPETTEALTVLFRATLEDSRSGNTQRVTDTLNDMALADPDVFFAEHFPADIAKRLAQDYRSKVGHLGELAAVLRSQLDKGRDQVVVEKFDSPDDPKAVGYQRAALEKMTKKAALYSVRLAQKDEATGFHLWSFMHDGKRFRWVGKLEKVLTDVGVRQDKILQLRSDAAADLADR